MATAKEQRLKTVISLSALINSSLDPLEVSRQAIAAATTLLDAEAGSLFLLDEARGEIFFEVALGDKGEAVQNLRLHRGEGIAGWVIEHATPLLVPDVRKDARFCALVDEKSRFVTRSILCVPVISRGRTIGALESINKRNGRFTSMDQEFLCSLSQQVAIALENARLYEENSRHLSTQLRQERQHRLEKERLVKDLHDGIGGIATNISLLAEIANRSTGGDISAGLSTIAELSREMINELRTFMNTLESADLTWQDLAAEIRSHGTAMLAAHTIDLEFAADLADPHGKISMFLYLSVFRVAKEALANIVKHAGATVVTVYLNVSLAECILFVTDNGCGFSAAGKAGRGLRNMRTRGADLNGTLEIGSATGTTVRLSVPLPFCFIPEEGGWQ